MDQIRFDFLNAQALTALNRNLPAPTDGSDAFSQILDQQLAKSNDAAAQPSQDNGRPAEDWRRPADSTDQQDAMRSKGSGRRRDDKPKATTAAAAKPKTVPKPVTSSTTSGGDKTAETADAGKASGEAKSQPDADKKDTTVTAQTSSDNATPTKTTAENQPGDKPDQNGQQQGQGEDGKSSTPQQDADASTDADLAALMIPLPLQTISMPVNTKANALLGGGATTPALQAALLVAANLNAGALNLAGAANVQAQTGTPGLKFSTLIPNPTPAQAKAGTDATTAGMPGANGSNPSDDSPDPSTAISALPGTPKPPSQSTGSTSPKSRGTATASSPVTAAYAGQSGAATTPSANAGVALPWAASTVAAGTSGEALPAPAVSGDSELSGWSSYLDADVAGAASTGISARTAAFLAQLKQNVQLPPAHEQVAIQIQKAMQNGSNRLTVNLEPAELGRVEVKLDVDKDKNVTATIVVDRPATLDLLQRDAKALERALQEAGLQTNDGSLSFSLRNGGGQGGGSGPNGQAGAGIGGGNAGSQASDAANQPARADVIATADGYVDVET